MKIPENAFTNICPGLNDTVTTNALHFPADNTYTGLQLKNEVLAVK